MRHLGKMEWRCMEALLVNPNLEYRSQISYSPIGRLSYRSSMSTTPSGVHCSLPVSGYPSSSSDDPGNEGDILRRSFPGVCRRWLYHNLW